MVLIDTQKLVSYFALSNPYRTENGINWYTETGIIFSMLESTWLATIDFFKHTKLSLKRVCLNEILI